MHFLQKNKKLFSSTEEVISMFLGLVIVVVVIGLVFTFFQKRKGDITLPGVSNYLDITQENTKKDNNKVENSKDTINHQEYIVVKNDNLWKIAEKKYQNGFMWNEIAKANNLKNPKVIAVGQKLIIPTLNNKTADLGTKKDILTNNSNTGSTKIATGEYIVAKNDNLWKIAVNAYGDGYQWVKIWDSNKNLIKNPGMIHVGTKLTIPNLGK